MIKMHIAETSDGKCKNQVKIEPGHILSDCRI